MRSLTSFFRRHLLSGPVSGTSTDVGPDKSENSDPRPSQDTRRDQSPARVFPSSGFDLIAPSLRLEEETNSWYPVKNFYAAAIGEIFQDTYQVIAKLGYGTASTTWLCRDLRHHRYVTLKLYASGEGQTAREVAALKHINAVLAASRNAKKHIGAASVRTLLDQFQVSRPKSPRTNLCLVFDPLGVSLADARNLVFGGRMPIDVVKSVTFYMLQALDFLHREANLVHGGMLFFRFLAPQAWLRHVSTWSSPPLTLIKNKPKDIQEDNIMFGVEDTSEWRAVEVAEMADPTPRKIYKDHAIHASRVLELPPPAVPVLCDFGEARFGGEAYGEHAMPDLYRAPEILLRIEWNEKIDIWALGLVVSWPRTCNPFLQPGMLTGRDITSCGRWSKEQICSPITKAAAGNPHYPIWPASSVSSGRLHKIFWT